MNEAFVTVRELAAWGLDDDDHRPTVYHGSSHSAHEFVHRKEPYDAKSALIEVTDHKLNERLKEEASRADLIAEMTGLQWSVGVVDLRLLLAFQRRITLESTVQEAVMRLLSEWDDLIDLCFGKSKPVLCEAIRTDASILLRSANPNLHFRITNDCSNPIGVHAGSPFFEVAQYRDRWFLRDGYHRAFRCLQDGIHYLPAVIVQARSIEELGATYPWFFSEQVLFSPRPPRVVDFLDDTLILEYNRSPLIKTLRITVEETYTLRGEDL